MSLLSQTMEDVLDEQDEDTVSSKQPPKKSKGTADDFYHSSNGSHLHSTSRFRRLSTAHDTGSHSIQQQTSAPLPRSDSSRLSALEIEIQSLKALKDGTAVIFCGLGFKSINDSNNWLLQHSPGKDFGLVVDVHTVMDHLNALIYGKDSTLSNLHYLARIKLKKDIEGIAVTSFEQPVPKLFSKASFKVVRNDCSYFDTIMSHTDRSTTNDGY